MQALQINPCPARQPVAATQQTSKRGSYARCTRQGMFIGQPVPVLLQPAALQPATLPRNTTAPRQKGRRLLLPAAAAGGPQGISSSRGHAGGDAVQDHMAGLTPDEARTVAVFRDCAPGVVNVSTSTPLPPILLPLLPPSLQERGQVPQGVGSGFIWDRSGHVVTNAHVIEGASKISVTLADGSVVDAREVGKDEEKDVAVLRLEGVTQEQREALTPLTLGSSSSLMVGQRVLAIGNAFGLSQTLTQGIVSALGREVPSGRPGMGGRLAISAAIQTDAAINPGNSGGPLLDSQGRVVGINTAILDPSGVGVNSGIGFAIPIDEVQGMVDQILRVGRVVRPALGLTFGPLPPWMARAIKKETANSNTSNSSMNSSSNSSSSGSKSASGSTSPSSNSNTSSTTASSKARLEKEGTGVLVLSVRPGGPADVAGIKGIRWGPFGRGLIPGDIITSLNGKPINTERDVYTELDRCKVGQVVEVGLRPALAPGASSRSGQARAGGSRTVRVVLADRERLTTATGWR